MARYGPSENTLQFQLGRRPKKPTPCAYPGCDQTLTGHYCQEHFEIALQEFLDANLRGRRHPDAPETEVPGQEPDMAACIP